MGSTVSPRSRGRGEEEATSRERGKGFPTGGNSRAGVTSGSRKLPGETEDLNVGRGELLGKGQWPRQPEVVVFQDSTVPRGAEQRPRDL